MNLIATLTFEKVNLRNCRGVLNDVLVLVVVDNSSTCNATCAGSENLNEIRYYIDPT